MLYGRRQLLLLSQSGFEQLLSASLIDKYHSYLCQFASAFYFCSLSVDRKKTMESVHSKRRRLLFAVLNTYFSKVLLINSINTYSNLFKNFIFVHHLLLGDNKQNAVQKKLIIASLMD